MTKFYLRLFCVIIAVIDTFRLSNAHYTQQWAVHIPGGSQVAEQVARDHGFDNHGTIFEDHYFFSHSGIAKRSLRANPEKRVRLAADTRVTWAQQQKAKKRVKRDLKLQDSDPKWASMWYLNRGEGLDMNVIPAWMDGITGKGAVVTILDDGLEKDHPDLLKNYDPLASYDVNNQDSDPSPRYDMIDSNRHGTRCAGEVAAQSNNSICALGIAHGAQVGGVRMLDGDVTDAVEARSLSLNPQHIHIYSASWGPDDDGKTVDGPGELASRAFVEGVTKGRGGKGSIFIWASGNGGRDHDNCNCDGYTNSIYSLSISSATENGNVPWYSEACSSTLASTYSSGAVNEKQVVTTDLRHSCTSSHTGTSASAPLAAGICALALEANPHLTWRDMQHIVVRTARPQHLKAPDWQVNGVGRNVSHSFGYGLMDAYAMVKLAREWIAVPEQHSCDISAPDQSKPIPAKSVVILTLQVNDCEGVEILEHVQAKLSIAAHRRGDLHIQLTSPMGTRVTLLAHRDHDNSRAGFTHWPFMSVHSWGERPFGKWQLEIRNDGRLMGRVTLHNWSLVIYGTKHFSPTSPSSNDIVSTKINKIKPGNGRKKPKKPKPKSGNQKNNQSKAPKIEVLKKTKSKDFLDVESAINNTILNVIKKPNNSSTTTTDVSPYFYAVSNSKVNLDHSNIVKHYLKFVKNITITYPVMIPAKDSPPRSFDLSLTKPVVISNQKAAKIKEKSRDINAFNHGAKVFVPKTTPKSPLRGTNAEIKTWDLTLYGTSERPAYDTKKENSRLNFASVYPEEKYDFPDIPPIGHNDIGYGDSETENRKDTQELKSTSGCLKWKGNMCLVFREFVQSILICVIYLLLLLLKKKTQKDPVQDYTGLYECTAVSFLHNGKCLNVCPEGFYNSRIDLNKNAEEMSSPNFSTCVSCHYSCKRCTGSMDYQCKECFSDALIYTSENHESYCYPTRVVIDILSEKWYYTMVVTICIMFIVFLSLIVAYLCCKKHQRHKYAPLAHSEIEDIRKMERDIKSTVYTDSE